MPEDVRAFSLSLLPFFFCFVFLLSHVTPSMFFFYLSFSLRITHYTQDDVINFQCHSVPLTNTLICLWKIREVCFSFHVHAKFIEKLFVS